MISQFFIHRPKFALIISIVITLIGLLSLFTLPVNMYPQIAPPQVSIAASFPGANAAVVEESVIRPIEQQINGVENMIYVESSASDGSAEITVTFKTGTDTDIAQVNVQNSVAIAENALPEEVRRQGVIVKKKSSNMLMGINLTSTDESMDTLFLSNYATNYLTEPLARMPGVAEVAVMGDMTYSMRIWLDPNAMTARDLTVSDVKAILQEQNVIVAAGRLGQGPNLPDQQFQYTIQAQGRLTDVREFENTIIRANRDGSMIRLRDIARIELGSKSYNSKAVLDNKPTAFIVVYQLSDANATEVAAAVRKEMERLSAYFPENLTHSILFDTTKFINESISEVVSTLYEAVGLVILVVFLFLQNWRATLIPTIAIPVSLIGTFAVMKVLGFTINTITLFGLVLAIGVVVDDAIVVIENVERLITKEGLAPIAATERAMKEVSGPIIATTLVLLAVFVPVSFMPGITGKLYNQFAITISMSVLISAVNALTLSPALCVLMLKEGNTGTVGFLAPFERFLSKLTAGYSRWISWTLRRSLVMGILFIILIGCTGFLAKIIPTGFVPEEDQGYLFMDIQLPDAASLNRTQSVTQEITQMVLQQPGVTNFVSVSGFSLLSGSGSNNGLGIVVLEDWGDRQTKEKQIKAIQNRLQGMLWAYPEAQVMIFNLPPIPGLGNSGGFDFRLQDTQSRSPQELAQISNALIYQANQNPKLQRVFSTYRANVPQYFLEVNRDKVKTQGVLLSDVFITLQAQLGSLYINDFNKFGRIYQVIIQAENKYRTKPEDLRHFYVRNGEGHMVPLSTLAKLRPIQEATSINHFNLYRSVSVTGQSAPNYSSGDAIQVMTELADSLPEGYTFEWAGQSRQEIEAGNMAGFLFALALIFVYLFLVAQYESWNLPFAVIASVPTAIFGAMASMFSLSMTNNIYAQIGMVLLIGLSAKTAILIVEFAIHLRSSGKSITDSAQTAAQLRFRAVLMTALSFVLGVLPLVVASGAGAASRQSLGTTVMFGMLSATILGTLLTPVLYQIIQRMREKFSKEKATQTFG